MEKIIVSACLLGENCRYDGLSKPHKEVIDLKEKYDLIPVCPEVMGGLPTPRMPSEVKDNRVIRKDGADVTEEYNKGAMHVLDLANENRCKIAILKARSPACGHGAIYDGTFTKTIVNKNGICAQHLIDNGITVIDETELDRIK